MTKTEAKEVLFELLQEWKWEGSFISGFIPKRRARRYDEAIRVLIGGGDELHSYHTEQTV
jgi:hypothetical protein